MQARDVMTVNVISVSEESPIHEIVRLLLKFRISAVPVVDSGRKVVGMISESDLLRPRGGEPHRNTASVVPARLECHASGHPCGLQRQSGARRRLQEYNKS